ncbi:MAG: DMT family transporter [Gammaproteobacteria bacterium]|nr:DMT family transporter [Gammaproteobacteria bacterium]
MSNQNRAYFFAAVAIFFWSTVASVFKLSLEHLAPIQLVFYATLFSITALFVVLVFQRKLALIRQYPKGDISKLTLLAFLNPCLYYIVLFEAYDRLPAQEAMAINYSWVVMMVLLSIPILKQRISIKALLGIMVSYVGVVVIATKGHVFALEFSSTLGVVLALSTTVIWALFWLFNTKKSNDIVVSLFLIFLLSLPFVSLAVFFGSEFEWPSYQGLLGGAYVGLFEMGITFVLWQSALSLSTTVAKVTSLAFITPFLSLMLLYLVLDETILPSTVIGIILIIGGLLMQKYFTRRDDIK